VVDTPDVGDDFTGLDAKEVFRWKAYWISLGYVNMIIKPLTTNNLANILNHLGLSVMRPEIEFQRASEKLK
jgi:hypothetical protein